ncbi:hypothetical protein [Dermacoccus barathri]|uniref:hypothetical protein n=1 Tax=Dermacoccus barathri TaxID=322601 RepID=UPI00187A642B|nr:hypothetical protein [Dermacoccus barathri]MBE7372059.1 hypothetical protein [Dermacoccus barathri]
MTQPTTTGQQHHEVPALARSKRRPALDGIRVLSVVAVKIYHANPEWIPGGYQAGDRRHVGFAARHDDGFGRQEDRGRR